MRKIGEARNTLFCIPDRSDYWLVHFPGMVATIFDFSDV
jgi:hypothetical protein